MASVLIRAQRVAGGTKAFGEPSRRATVCGELRGARAGDWSEWEGDSQEGREVIQDAGWAGGQPGWLDLIRWIFGNGWWRRSNRRACHGGRRRPVLGSASGRRSTGSPVSRDGQLAARRWAAAGRRRFGSIATWLVERCREQDFTLRGLVGELGERGLRSITARSGSSSTPRS